MDDRTQELLAAAKQAREWMKTVHVTGCDDSTRERLARAIDRFEGNKLAERNPQGDGGVLNDIHATD